MLYQSYKRKLAKLTNAFEFAWRFRYLILVALVVIIALVSTLCAISGNVYAENCSPTFVYGETPTAQAKAIFRKVYFEYRYKGDSNWSDEIPWRVGDYEVRAYSARASGTKKYGATLSFTILPKQTTVMVQDGGFVYGDTPIASAQLVGSDYIDTVDFTYDWQQNNVCNVTAHVLSVKSVNGDDVTACYQFNSPTNSVSITPRPITVKVSGATKVYDGTPLTAHNADYSLVGGSLVDGDVLANVTFPSSRTDVGETPNQPVIVIKDANSNDVTNRYNITFDADMLTVTPRPVFVTTPSQTWIYHEQDTPYSAVEGFVVSDDLLKGHTVQCVSATELYDVTDSITSVVQVDNKLQFTIFDADGQDVTRNYSISYDYGQLRVKSPVTINIYTIRKYYDGEKLSITDEDFAVAKRPPDVRVQATDAFYAISLTNVGIISLDQIDPQQCFAIYDLQGNEVTSNNEVYIVGEDCPIEVMLRPIEITTISISRTRENSTLLGNEAYECYWVSKGSLVKGHTISVEVTGILSQDESRADNTVNIDNTHIYDAKGNDVTDFYVISYKLGELKWIE